MSEQKNTTEELSPAEASAELYQRENEALAIADIYEDIEFSKDNPTSKDAMKTGMAEDAWEGTVKESDEFAQANIDEIHEAAIAEAARRVSDVYDTQGEAENP